MKSIAAFQKLTGFELPRHAENEVQRLMLELKEHDIGTYEHCGRVSEMCLTLAQDLQLDLIDQAIAVYSGLLHDVGKIKVPGFIINKPSKLTNDEFDIMKKHTVFGVELIESLQNLPFFRKVSEAIMYHHERVDGNGYHKIAPSEIPYISKVILVADTVDAMGEDRAYRKGLSIEVIVDELIRCSGTQFDPHIVNVFLDSLSRKKKIAA